MKEPCKLHPVGHASTECFVTGSNSSSSNGASVVHDLTLVVMDNVISRLLFYKEGGN